MVKHIYVRPPRYMRQYYPKFSLDLSTRAWAKFEKENKKHNI